MIAKEDFEVGLKYPTFFYGVWVNEHSRRSPSNTGDRLKIAPYLQKINILRKNKNALYCEII